jgi:hypothetical protein
MINCIVINFIKNIFLLTFINILLYFLYHYSSVKIMTRVDDSELHLTDHIFNYIPHIVTLSIHTQLFVFKICSSI